MHRGYIKLWRKISENPLWTDSKFTPGQAWIDLILLANHKNGHIRVRGVKVEVLRGVCGWSQAALAERWRWSRGKVIRFLNELETIQQIEQQKNNVTTLIKIINYDEYQANGQQTVQQTVQQTDSKRYTNKNDKNEKNDNIKTFLPDSPEINLSEKLFERIQQNNPKAKKPNLQAWAKHIDLMIRVDKRTAQEIDQVIAWCQSDPFWKCNILSTAKVREKFDQLFIKMENTRQSSGCRMQDANMEAARRFLEKD